MTNMEIERKFLLLPCIADELLSLWQIPYINDLMEQFYVPTEDSPKTRYRQKGTTYYQTIKTGEGMVRQEYEHEVNKEEYAHYRNLTEGGIITKNRYTFNYEENTYELDIFHGRLEGLCYLEIEFDDEQKAQNFTLPSLFNTLVVCEVTFDRDFNNSTLAISDKLPIPKLDFHHSEDKKNLYTLSPFLTVDKTLTTLMYHLSKGLQKHRKNLLKDPSDVEELHKFRVNLRKLRAVIKEFEDFFDPTWYQAHSKRLSMLMKSTNAKRDNDVAMIDMGVLRKELPSSKDKTLDSLKHSLRKNNRLLEEKLVKFLQSDTLKDELKSLKQLSKEPEMFLPTATQPLILIAIFIINARCNTIVDEARNIDEETEYDVYHKLRIQFKKLRYILELLAPITDQQKLDIALDELRKIQIALGNVNDIYMQEKNLNKFRKSYKGKKTKSLKKLQEKMKVTEAHNKRAFDEAIRLFKNELSLYQTLLYRSAPITL